jgi:uncharacterized protein YgiM (DUF1202 family)
MYATVRRITARLGAAARVATLAILVAALIAGLGPMLLAPAPAAAASFSNGDLVVVNTDALNLRSGPGTGNSVLAVLPTGTLGTVTDGPRAGSGYTWYKISVTGVAAGWVAADFIALADSQNAQFPLGVTVAVNTDALNVRKLPSLSSAVITVLVASQTGTVLDGPRSADGYTWYEVDAGSTAGWVAGEYLVLAGSDLPGFPLNAAVVVNTDALNVRSVAGLNADVIAVATLGDRGTVLSNGPTYADGYAWFRVRFASVEGWVASNFLALDNGGQIPIGVGDRVAVTVDGLNVRSEPGLSGDVLQVLPFGASAKVSGGPVAADGFDWYQLENSSGQTLGWVAGDFISWAQI